MEASGLYIINYSLLVFCCSNCNISGAKIDPTEIRGIYESFPAEEKENFLRIMNLNWNNIEEYFINITSKANAGDSDPIPIQPSAESVENRIRKQLLLFLPPFIFIIGVIGNTMSFVILSQRAMRVVSTYAYLTVLTFADTMVLFVGLLRLWITELTGSDLRVWTQWSCKLVNVLGSTISDFSGWLIIAVTAERFLAVCYPLKAPMVCSRHRAYAIVLILLAFHFLVNMHLFWTTQLTYTVMCGGIITVRCDPAEAYSYLVRDVWPWVDAFMYSFIPFAVILVLNALIIRKVLISRRNRDSHLCRGSSSSSAKESSARMSVMLLTVSFAFLVTTLPLNITLIVTNSMEFSTDGKNKMKLGRAVTELLMYVNHSMNFFLYCATGQKFRQELCAIVCRGRWRRAQRTMTSHHTETAMIKLSAMNTLGRR